jgi:hypothetical protein
MNMKNGNGNTMNRKNENRMNMNRRMERGWIGRTRNGNMNRRMEMGGWLGLEDWE